MPDVRFEMKRPCEHCPFRCDIRPFLVRARVENILAEITEDQMFLCHETTGVKGGDQPRDEKGRFKRRLTQHCAGALILLRKTDREGQMQQVAYRLGMYDRDGLDLKAPVFDSLEAMIEAQE